MVKKGYNWKARQVVDTVVDDSQTKKIRLDFELKGNFSQSNEFALPSEKRSTKIKGKKSEIARILSNKHRKRLEKIVDRIKKKENRADLLTKLSQVQATPEELSQLTSISSVQTKGLKKYIWEQQNPDKVISKAEVHVAENDVTESIKKGDVKRWRGVRLNLINGAGKKQVKTNDPNVVGFDSSDSDSDLNDSDEDDSEEGESSINEGDSNKNEDDFVIRHGSLSEDPEKYTVSKEDVEENKIDEDEIPNKKQKLSTENKQTRLITPAAPNKDTVVVKTKDKSEPQPKRVDRKPAVYVHVSRTKEIQKARLKLPILAEEQQIMEIINENSVVVLAGETGSGKTTQVPQFLYEAGYARNKMIAVTEPRRVAAISMSKRVAEEMNLTSTEVSYLIRFEGNVTDDTKIKFMTDGVLLKEIQKDFILSKYSVIILDEAHERSVYTDILIGFLSRISKLRTKNGDPLKLIIMSATLRLKDFTENPRLFKIPPPVINVDARQFPVTCHFNKRTDDNYLKVAFDKAVKIHTTLPDGGILIFVTGQQEVNMLVRKLRKAFPFKGKSAKKNAKGKEEGADQESGEEDEEELKKALKKKRKVLALPKIDLDDYGLPGEIDEGDCSDNLESENEELNFETSVVMRSHPMWVLPLYSLLPAHKQAQVFDPPPPGCRLCIVSTNVAETSLTIPNIKYVVDTGKTKVKLYDKTTGVTSYVVTWTSKASADQRAGRAGRMGPGHCYRLYSSAVFNDTFEQFSEPEICQKPVDDLFLQLKCMGIDKVQNFPYPTAPDYLQLKAAEMRLHTLGALKDGVITPIGKAISRFPVLPRYGKMLALSHQQNLMPYTICIVAALSVQEVLLETPVQPTSNESLKEVRQKWTAVRRQWAGTGNSLLLGDPMVLLKAVGAAEYANSEGKLEKFCLENGLRQKAIVEIRKLRIQLTNVINMNIVDANVIVDPRLQPPSDAQTRLLRQVLLAGMGDQLAKKIMPQDVKQGEDKMKYKYAYWANNMEEPVFLHQGSVLKRILPEFVIYQEIYETNKMYMRGVTAIEPEWLATYVPTMCQLSEPIEGSEKLDSGTGKVHCSVTGTYGTQAWKLPQIEMEYPATNIENYKWFARFLLEGKVFVKLAKYTSSLLSNPSTMVKSWAKLQPRTVSLLQGLVNNALQSKGDLKSKWKESPKFLLKEYLEWLPKSSHAEFSLLWPPLDT